MGQLSVALLFFIVICMCNASLGFTCKEAERNALFKFKHSIEVRGYICADDNIDRCNNLTSWVGEDCCIWKGVGCDNVTGNVIKLDLGNNGYEPHLLKAGEVIPGLLELKYLTYLDLSGFDFGSDRIPEFFGSMTQLQHLNLSAVSICGRVPPHLGNLTKLVVLDLGNPWIISDCGFLDFLCNSQKIEANSLEWAFKLKNLKYLDLSGIDMSQALDSLNILHKLPSLSVLNLACCRLGNSHLVTRNSTISSSTLQSLDFRHNNFSGPIPGFIQNLSSIRSLDLSHNHFSSPIPSWLSKIGNLRHLSLRYNGFNGPFPGTIQNLSFLTSLDLSYNQFSSSIPSWLANKTELEYLDLSVNQFNRVDGGITNTIGCLCRLTTLILSDNQLQDEVAESHVNFSRCSRYDLQYLSMSFNNMSGYLPINGGLSSLESLFLSYNNFSVVSPVIGRLLSLEELYLSFNQLETLPSSFQRLSSLTYLHLSHNHIRVLPPLFGSLLSLEELDLSFNQLETLPAPSFQGLSSLTNLDLSYNHLRVMPTSIGSLSSLRYLYLSYNNLSVVHQVNLADLSSLVDLDISSNSAIFLDLSPDWIPPFQLSFLNILPCKLNSPFPDWILSQKWLSDLDLSDSGIFGTLPINIGNAMPSLQSLRLANNHINGSIPTSLCGIQSLGNLDLQKNRLSGKIPDCWENSQIVGVELSSNRLSGHIPNSLTKVATLQLLSLNNNSLEGELPLALSNSPRLTILDVGKNNLHGEIPPWNGATFPLLQVLILRENRFNGTIPLRLCWFHVLQIIDLASNNLVGTIPWCFGYLQGMGSLQHSSVFIASAPSPAASNVTSDFASEPAVSPDEWSAVEVVKGDEREYTTNLHLLRNMDLSCNHLVGVIPAEITSLSRLLGLNLSHNHLNGTIPVEMGKMSSLESLDLSFNNLSGSIPETISSLDSLSNMNFSFNNLRGQIPTGRHLQTLNDSSIYMGNPGLCGDPLPKKCFGDNSAHPPTSAVLEDEGDNKREKMWFYMVIMLGFAVGFWGFIGLLVVHKRWRYAYFQIAEELADWIYVRVAVRIAQANRGR